MSDIISNSRLIAELGILIVCGGIVITFVVIMFFMLKKQNDDMLSRFMKLVDDRPSEEDILKHTEEVNNRLRIDQEIQNALEDIVKVTDSSRVYLMEFHNGERNLSGLSLSKMTMTFEVTKPIVSPRSGEFKAIPLSLIPQLISILYSDRYYDCTDMMDLEERHPLLYQLCASSNCKAAFVRAILDTNDNLVGYIGASFLNDEIESGKVEQINEKLKTTAYKISTMLNLVDRIKDKS